MSRVSKNKNLQSYKVYIADEYGLPIKLLATFSSSYKALSFNSELLIPSVVISPVGNVLKS